MIKLNKLKFFSGIILSLFFFSSFSQTHSIDSLNSNKKSKRNILKSNPLAFIWSQIPGTGEIRLMYERVTDENESSVLSLSFIVPSILIIDSIRAWEKKYGFNLKLYGVRLQVAQRFYLSGITKRQSPKGFYLSPHASFYMAKLYIKGFRTRYIKGSFTNFNLLFGYQNLLFDLIAFDVYAGLGYRYNFYTEGDSQNPIPIDMGRETGIPNWLKISFSMNTGIAF